MKLSDQVVRQLLELVQNRAIQPGERLPAERQLAQELGVSRPSLREAIQKLVSQGVLTSRRGDGTYVQSLDAAEWLQPAFEPLTPLLDADPQYRYDVIEARRTLEGGTAWYAAQRATPADLEKIRRGLAIMEQYQSEGNAPMAARADAQFHLAIAEASHNLVLVQVMHSIFSLVLSTVERDRHSMFSPHFTGAADALNTQHRALVDAIAARDAHAAKHLMHDHLDYVQRSIQSIEEADARQRRASRLDAGPGLPLPLPQLLHDPH